MRSPLPRTKKDVIEELLGGPWRRVGEQDGIEVVVPAAILERHPRASPETLLASRPPRTRGRLNFVELWVLRWGLVHLIASDVSERAHRVDADVALRRPAELVAALRLALGRFLRAFPPSTGRLSEEVRGAPSAMEAVSVAQHLQHLLRAPFQYDRRRVAEASTYGDVLRRRAWAPVPGEGTTRTQESTWVVIAGLRVGLSTARDIALVAALENAPLGRGGALLRAKTATERSRAVTHWNRLVLRARALLARPR